MVSSSTKPLKCEANSWKWNLVFPWLHLIIHRELSLFQTHSLTCILWIFRTAKDYLIEPVFSAPDYPHQFRINWLPQWWMIIGDFESPTEGHWFVALEPGGHIWTLVSWQHASMAWCCWRLKSASCHLYFLDARSPEELMYADPGAFLKSF